MNAKLRTIHLLFLPIFSLILFTGSENFVLAQTQSNIPAADEALKIPNQEDLEKLFKYMKKYVDALEGEGSSSALAKKKLFMNKEGQIEFNKLLNKFGFKPVFKDVSFSIKHLTFDRAHGIQGYMPIRYTSLFTNIILNDASFDGVKLDNIDMSGSDLNNVSIYNSTLNQYVCTECDFDTVNIDNSFTDDADFSFSTGNLVFNNNTIAFLKLTDSKFNNLEFVGGTLKNSVFINSGNINISPTVETFNNVTDTSAPGTLPLKSVGLIFEANAPGRTTAKIYNIIKESNYQPIKIEYGLTEILEEEKILKEVGALQKKAVEENNNQSIAQNMLRLFNEEPSSYPELANLEKMLQGYVKHLDSLIIPGGLDIEPYFYNKNISANYFYNTLREKLEDKKDVETEDYPIRTMIELILLDLSIKKQIPLFLICRGAQIYNVLKGGKILENLPDIYKDIDLDKHERIIEPYMNLSKEDKEHPIMELFKKEGQDGVKVYGNHHQAIDLKHLPEDIRILLIWKMPDGEFLPYALFDSTYKPGAWLTQFHPEVKEKLGGRVYPQLPKFNRELYNSFFKLMGPQNITN